MDFVFLQACESISGFISNDYRNKISFLSTRLAIDSNVSFLLKQAAVRSLSCEVVPGREGQIYFGDSACGHVLSNTFFLKDAQARGFHRWYSIFVFMKDKHFLLNSWPFFQKHINQIVAHLQKKAMQVPETLDRIWLVWPKPSSHSYGLTPKENEESNADAMHFLVDFVYSNEQIICSQRAFRLCSLDQNLSFTRLHLWFAWLLSTGAKRLEETYLPAQIQNGKGIERGGKVILAEEEERCKGNLTEENVCLLKRLRDTIGGYNFQRILYSTLIGQQVIVRGPKTTVESVIKLLVLFLPGHKVRCQEYGDTYKTPDVCNIVGVNLCAAVPKSSDTILRLDILPSPVMGDASDLSVDYRLFKFIIRNECELPKKLPTFLVKIEKVLSDDNLTDRIVWLHIKSLMEQWFHIANVIREVKRNKGAGCVIMALMQSLGVQEQDNKLIQFWTG